MVISTEAVLSVVVVIVGAIAAWIVNLHGRISAHERGCEERQNTLNERHQMIQRELQSLHKGQASMSQKLDRLLEADS